MKIGNIKEKEKLTRLVFSLGPTFPLTHTSSPFLTHTPSPFLACLLYGWQVGPCCHLLSLRTCSRSSVSLIGGVSMSAFTVGAYLLYGTLPRGPVWSEASSFSITNSSLRVMLITEWAASYAPPVSPCSRYKYRGHHTPLAIKS